MEMSRERFSAMQRAPSPGELGQALEIHIQQEFSTRMMSINMQWQDTHPAALCWGTSSNIWIFLGKYQSQMNLEARLFLRLFT